MKFEIPIEVKSTHVQEKRGTSREGKQFHIREQSVYLDIGKAYPVEIKVPLVDGDLNPPDFGERRGLVAGAPVLDLSSSSVF